VNANPSGSRTPSTGGRGRSIARRRFASTTELPLNCLLTIHRAGCAGPVNRHAIGSGSGTRHAMKACRGGPNPKRAAQGRSGEIVLPRHVDHLVLQPLPLANRSATADRVRRPVLERSRHFVQDERAFAATPSRPKAQPRDHDAPWPDHKARDTKLAQPMRSIALTPEDGPSEGKES
jgi:hypothetical protein